MDDDIAEVLGRIEEKLDSIIDMLGKKGIKTGGEGNIKPTDKKFDEQMEDMPESGGRAQCPECGSLKVKDMKDKNRVLSMSGGIAIYATKHVCNECGHEW